MTRPPADLDQRAERARLIAEAKASGLTWAQTAAPLRRERDDGQARGEGSRGGRCGHPQRGGAAGGPGGSPPERAGRAGAVRQRHPHPPAG